MQSANLSGPLKGRCLYKALIGLTQASGLAGGFDSSGLDFTDSRLLLRIDVLYCPKRRRPDETDLAD